MMPNTIEATLKHTDMRTPTLSQLEPHKARKVIAPRSKLRLIAALRNDLILNPSQISKDGRRSVVSGNISRPSRSVTIQWDKKAGFSRHESNKTGMNTFSFSYLLESPPSDRNKMSCDTSKCNDIVYQKSGPEAQEECKIKLENDSFIAPVSHHHVYMTPQSHIHPQYRAGDSPPVSPVTLIFDSTVVTT